jgi:hypothetical protein
MENKKEGAPALVPQQVTAEAHKEKQIEKVDVENKKEEGHAVVPQQMTVEVVKQESVEIVAQPQASSDAAQETTPVKAEVNNLILNDEPEATLVEVSLEESIYFLNEQGVLVYLPPKDIISTSTLHHSQEESDEFFELTEEEVRRMMTDLIYQNNQIQNAPLITAQLRREQEEKRRLQMLEKYPTTVLRIQFSDRFILQMPVPSEITLGEVKQQLQEYLEVSIEVDKFELFTTPPKQVIETSSTLHEIGLTPSSLVYISSHCVLKEKFRLSPSCYAGAVRDASRRLNRSTKPSTITTATTNTGESGVSVTTTKDQRPKRPASDTSAATASANKNVPKWLKMNR